MTGILATRKCVGCGNICRPYATGPLELKMKKLSEDDYHVNYVVQYSCDNCDLVQFFEIDGTHVRYFEDLERERKRSEINNPTWECKDCNHDYDRHSKLGCMGISEEKCTCFKFAFTKSKK